MGWVGTGNRGGGPTRAPTVGIQKSIQKWDSDLDSDLDLDFLEGDSS